MRKILKQSPIKPQFLLGLILLCTQNLFAQSGETNAADRCSQASALVEVFGKLHVNPRTIDDTFSFQLFELTIQSLDKTSSLFTNQDIERLSVHQFKIDDQINNKSCEFLTDLTRVYSEKLEKVEKAAEEILSTPMDFEKKDKIKYSYKTKEFKFSDNDEKLKDWWRKKLKLQVLEISRKSDTKEQILQREEELRSIIKTRLKRNFASLRKPPSGIENFVSDVYLNSITNLYDPHSSYFSVNEKQLFQDQLSREVLSFGIDVEENKAGRIEVVRLIPGGPAWKSNQMHQGDVLDKLIYESGEEVDLNGLSEDEIVELFRAEKANKITLEFTKSSGIANSVKLQKEKVRADENIIKSFVLKGKENIGYVSLPGFYTEWSDENQRGCADDMARELTKLQMEDIKGLVLDLRYNGGGSLDEAIELAGIFVDEGVLFMATDANGRPSNARDRNRGTIFDGPLIILVNEASASASEILSATLQDYNRAVIIGSTTYGKATSQNIMPLEVMQGTDMIISKNSGESAGYVKVTRSKLYRVTGQSYQKKGVIPDVKLPSLIEGLVATEADEPFALDAKPIEKTKYFTPMDPLPLEKLSAKCEERVVANTMFQKVVVLNDSLKDTFAKDELIKSLDIDEFIEDRKAPGVISELEKIKLEENNLYKVENHKYDQTLLDMDAYGKELNQIIVKQLGEDIYIAEAYLIMLDFIKLGEE